MRSETEDMTGLPVLDIDSESIPYRELNTRVRRAVVSGQQKIIIRNVHGQRYIGTNLAKPVELEIHGSPGNDLGAFMDGPRIIVHGDTQDGCGNAMRSGEIVVHGCAGNAVGLSARGGRILVRDDAGCRIGIHMKNSKEEKPVVVIGGMAQDFLGEYMAGGTLIMLGLNPEAGHPYAAGSVGVGMHGGAIYLRGAIGDDQLSKDVRRTELDEKDQDELRSCVAEFAARFGGDAEEILKEEFTKLSPLRAAQRSTLYAY